MELFAKRMTWELDNDEGLSCLFFELEDGCFTLSRKTGAETLRLEMDQYKITLFGCSRISIHADEYIWSFIEENIVKPHKLMRSEKHGYLLDIAFNQFEPEKHRYFSPSAYNGSLREDAKIESSNRSYFREDFADGKVRTTWFSPNTMWTNCGDKVLNVDIKAANVSENITPREYADFLFDGIGAVLAFNFKRRKREEFDALKPKID